MKKNIYVKPETTVVLVETETMMAASTFSASFSEETIEAGYVDAKGHGSSIWDFDDED